MKFDELSEDLKQKVLNRNRDINLHPEWDEDILDQFKEDLENSGMVDINIQYSGFSSQGDGASFTGRIIDMFEFLTKSKIDFGQIEFIRGGFSYVNSSSVKTDDINFPHSIEEWRQDKCVEIYNTLSDEYDHLTSDEEIYETIKCRDYDFDEEGNICR